MRTGELRVSREVPDIQLPGKTLFLSHRFGSLDGFKLIDPEAKKLEPKFGPHIAFLGEALALSDEQWDAKVNQLDEPGRAVQVKKLGKALDDARYLRAEITDLRSFLAPDNIGTFRAWGSPETEGSPIGAYARRDGSTLRVGSSERRTMPVQIPLDLELDIPSVAGLAAKRP